MSFHPRVRSQAVVALVAAALTAVTLSACQHDPVGVESQPPVDFATQVQPIFQNNCAKSGCHDGGGDGFEMDLSDPLTIQRNVTAGKPGTSRLYQAITDTWGGIMPPDPNPPLTRDQRTTIALWILQGASITSK